MNDAFEKIKWANKRIDQLKVAIDGFIKLNPYSVRGKRNPQTQEPIYYLARKDDIPPDIVLLAGDVLQNLRTALDYAIVALAPAAMKSDRKLGFPIFESIPPPPDDEAKFAGKVGCLRHEAQDYIKQIKPYKGGNRVLWRLHELNIRDKHRLLFSAGLVIQGFNVGQHLRVTREVIAGGAVEDMWIQPRGILIVHNVGDEILRDTPNAKMNEDIQLESTVAFNEPGVSEGEPIEIVVRESLNWTQGIILDLAKYL
jgi:hypothetical protein